MSNGKPPNVEELKKKILAIAPLAADLYDLLFEGMAVEILIPEKQTIVVPNKEPRKKSLIIFKPASRMNMELARGD